MFDFDNQLLQNNSPRIAAVRAMKQTAIQRQRDVYDSHRHRTFALAFYMTGNEMEAEEILTSTFVRAFSSSPEPDARQIDSALMGELEKRFTLGEHEAAATPEAVSVDGANLSGRNVRRTELEEAIQMLPATERLLFLLRDVEGYTPADIADLLKIPESKVHRSLFSARIRLRQSLIETAKSHREAA